MTQKDSTTLNVSLTAQLQEFVSKKVESGRYQSASEVVREALRAMEERDLAYQARLQQLRGDIRLGLDQLAHGQKKPFDEAALERIKTSGRKRLAASRKRTGQ